MILNNIKLNNFLIVMFVYATLTKHFVSSGFKCEVLR